MDVGVLLAGGVGSRFWPLSKKHKPKQFLMNLNGKSFLKTASERLDLIFDGIEFKKIVVTQASYQKLVEADVPDALILSEHEPRNTAPAVAFAVAKSLSLGAKRMVIMPADHWFNKESEIVRSIKLALDFVNESPLLVLFGTQPLFPHTGYGYIKIGESVNRGRFESIKYVRRFFEKPNLERAKQYVESGNFLWNMGIFVWTVNSILKAFEDELPEYYDAILEMADMFKLGEPIPEIAKKLLKLEPVSIDIGLVERVRNIAVCIVSDSGWNDIGSLRVWIDLIESHGAQSNKHISVDSEDVKVFSEDGLIVTIGIKDVIIVKKDDVVLICSEDKIQEVGKIPRILAEKGLDEYI